MSHWISVNSFTTNQNHFKIKTSISKQMRLKTYRTKILQTMINKLIKNSNDNLNTNNIKFKNQNKKYKLLILRYSQKEFF